MAMTGGYRHRRDKGGVVVVGLGVEAALYGMYYNLCCTVTTY